MPLLSHIPDPNRVAVSPGVPLRTWLLADDLTGACDAGAAFLRSGFTVRVWVGAQPGFAAPESVQTVNTNSRALPPAEAAHIVAGATAALAGDSPALFFKKVDSTLRGPVAAELDAARRALCARAILLAPAFPAMGRVVRHGVLQAQDISGRRATISIRDLFSPEMREGIAFIGHPDRLSSALASEKTVLICDSTTQADLDALAHAAQALPGLLYAGSAGLAQALASLHTGNVSQAAMPPAERTLLICGTPHPVTALQLESLDHEQFPTTQVLRMRCEGGDEARVRDAFHALRPHALVLTGGDTALLALHALGVHSLLLKGECAVGIPWSVAEGGPAQGCTVVTKSGGFGARSALHDILQMLTGSA